MAQEKTPEQIREEQERGFYNSLRARTPKGASSLATKTAIGAYNVLRSYLGFYPKMCKFLAQAYSTADNPWDSYQEEKTEQEVSKAYRRLTSNPQIQQDFELFTKFCEKHNPNDALNIIYRRNGPRRARNLNTYLEIKNRMKTRSQKALDSAANDFLKGISRGSPEDFYAFVQKAIETRGTRRSSLQTMLEQAVESGDLDRAAQIAGIIGNLQGGQRNERLEDILYAMAAQQARAQQPQTTP